MDEEMDPKTAALHAVADSRDQYRDQVARLQGKEEAYKEVIEILARRLQSYE